MSFVTVAPHEVQAAARNLAGIRSMLAESSASAAAPTAGVAAAAEDQVSAQVATLFSAFGQDYQVISAQAQEFHGQFVDVLGAGAGGYLGADAANAEQGLRNAVGSLGIGAPVGQSVNGAVAALQNGGDGLPAALSGFQQALAPTGRAGLASIAGPYQALFGHTAANMRIVGSTWLANPAPFLQQFLANQTGYARTIAAGAEYIIENFPAVVAGLPANIRSFVQVLLAFNPVPYMQQFIANHGNFSGAIGTLIDGPAVIADTFLIGQSTLPINFDLSGFPVTVNLPLNGILVPATPYTASLDSGIPVIGTVTVPVGGTPISGLATGLLIYAPEQLAAAITPAG